MRKINNFVVAASLRGSRVLQNGLTLCRCVCRRMRTGRAEASIREIKHAEQNGYAVVHRVEFHPLRTVAFPQGGTIFFNLVIFLYRSYKGAINNYSDLSSKNKGRSMYTETLSGGQKKWETERSCGRAPESRACLGRRSKNESRPRTRETWSNRAETDRQK